MAICRSIAQGSGAQCKKNALPGSHFCLYHQDYRPLGISFVVSGAITVAITVLSIQYMDRRDATRAANRQAEQAPGVEVSVTEGPNDYLTLELSAARENQVPITTLDTKFDIPGTLESWDKDHSEGLDGCELEEWFKSGGAETTYAQTINVRCANILPGAFFRARLAIRRTGLLPIPGAENFPELRNLTFTPLMDLHDISRIEYSWLFDGKPVIEKSYLDLSELGFIIDDNANLRAQISRYAEPGAVRTMEEERRDW